MQGIATSGSHPQAAPRFVEIDALKVAGIATVVLIHCLRSPPWQPFASQLELWAGHVTRFGVPAFLLASGFLYAGAPVGLRGTLQRLRRILLPYLVASLAAQAWWWNLGVSTETGSFWIDLAFGSSMGPYYYVFVIACLVVLTPGLLRLPAPVVWALTAGLIGSQWYVDAALGSNWIPYWHFRSPFMWWGYFLVGWCLRLHYAAVRGWLRARRTVAVAALVAAVAGLAVVSGTGTILDLSVRTAAWLNIYAILALVFVAASRVEVAPPWLVYASDATYAIFLWHLFFVTTAQRYLPPPPLRAELLPIAGPWLAGVVGPLVLIALARAALGARSRLVIGA